MKKNHKYTNDARLAGRKRKKESKKIEVVALQSIIGIYIIYNIYIPGIYTRVYGSVYAACFALSCLVVFRLALSHNSSRDAVTTKKCFSSRCRCTRRGMKIQDGGYYSSNCCVCSSVLNVVR